MTAPTPTAPTTALPIGSVDVREVTAGPPEVGRLLVDGVTGLQGVVDRVRDRAVARAARDGDGAGTPAERDVPQRVSELARPGPLDG